MDTKKIFIGGLLLVLLFALLISGCSQEPEEDKSQTQTTRNTNDAEAQVVSDDPGSMLSKKVVNSNTGSEE